MLSSRKDKDVSLISSKRLFILSLSSMLGIGIFLKAKSLIELSNQSFSAILSLFLVALILIGSMGWIFTKLVEKHSKSNRSFIEWIEEYCSTACKNWALKYTRNLAHPISILSTSIFLIKWINGASFLWVWESSICALLIGVIIISLNLFSLKWALSLQKFLSLAIFLSLIYLSAFGLHAIISGNISSKVSSTHINNLSGINSLGSWTILLSGLPSIFFMYDGFYSVLSLREKVKEKTSFKKIIALSFLTITLLYIFIISIILFAEPSGGDFLKIPIFKEDKNFKDVLIILISLTFLSSLNISAMFAQNQMFELHCRYNFREINSLRWSFISRGKNLANFRLESKMSICMHLMKKMLILALLISLFSQIIYWINADKNIFWALNDILAELNSLIIFLLLGKVIWSSRRKNKLHHLVSISIFVAFGYYLVNNFAAIFIKNLTVPSKEGDSSHWISLLKFFTPLLLIFSPSFSQIRYRINNLGNFSLKTLKFKKLGQEYSLLRYSPK